MKLIVNLTMVLFIFSGCSFKEGVQGDDTSPNETNEQVEPPIVNKMSCTVSEFSSNKKFKSFNVVFYENKISSEGFTCIDGSLGCNCEFSVLGLEGQESRTILSNDRTNVDTCTTLEENVKNNAPLDSSQVLSEHQDKLNLHDNMNCVVLSN